LKRCATRANGPDAATKSNDRSGSKADTRASRAAVDSRCYRPKADIENGTGTEKVDMASRCRQLSARVNLNIPIWFGPETLNKEVDEVAHLGRQELAIRVNGKYTELV